MIGEKKIFRYRSCTGVVKERVYRVFWEKSVGEFIYKLARAQDFRFAVWKEGKSSTVAYKPYKAITSEFNAIKWVQESFGI